MLVLRLIAPSTYVTFTGTNQTIRSRYAMSPNANLEADFEFFYSERVTRASQRLEQAALGHAVGVGGYTTVAQANGLIARLQLDPQDLLLDLGAGRGWPGVYIA
ncbi:MAG: hypothetical protein WCA29_14035, partial [Jiangellales bacterium]